MRASPILSLFSLFFFILVSKFNLIDIYIKNQIWGKNDVVLGQTLPSKFFSESCRPVLLLK